MISLLLPVILSCLLSTVFAAPAPILTKRDNSQATTAVSDATIDGDFVRPAQFSRIAYCSTQAVTSWQCGEPCAAVGNVTFLQAGGGDGLIPMYFIAHDQDTQTIVVAHQGTDPENILSIANDAQFLLTDLNTTLFPQAGQGVQVHDGFQKTFERTADGVLSGVQNALSSTGATKVLVTGHSLGAAIATMDAVMLKMNLDPSISLTSTVFGLPRGGDQSWADLVNSNLGTSFTHITNQNDPVPTVPPEFLGYQHPQGEVHIVSANATGATQTVACPGTENDNCSDGNSLLHVDVANHLGPYFQNISLSSKACPF
ncbi:alpha/beta-hydrolase [Neolentinus lepideus HHB14362 ss-1]|uniref:Alpha/beta-hydrolase n=1 Tax=Neolentinus lepideus HHB14362 ss-1 TaxID=1314782 RepID=A0A165SLV9_9AGAM|nr:alpha/beta-hydrolase [Neolentinus lepideus HHB14362 ss-1]